MYTIFHKDDPPNAVSPVFCVKTEDEALNEFAKELGYDSFAEYCEDNGASREEFEIYSAE